MVYLARKLQIDEELPDEAEDDGKKFDSKGLFYSKVTLETDNMPETYVKQNLEYRFMLLRQWSLEKAMKYSTYVSTSLKLWREDNKKALNHITASIGIPQTEAQQMYKFM